MLLFKALTYFIIFSVANSEEEMCKNNFTDKEKTTINITEYCTNKTCIPKCCGVDQIFNYDGICEDGREFKELYFQLDFANISLPSWPELSPEGVKPRKYLDNVVFIHNLVNHTCYYEYDPEDVIYYILQDGKLMIYAEHASELWITSRINRYCIDYKYFEVHDENNNTTTPTLILIVMELFDDMGDTNLTIIFNKTMIPLSCFFLFLVLVVYSLLPELRSTGGLAQMAYTLSLFIAYLLQFVLLFISNNFDETDCSKYSPFLYFFMMSSFFWLNIMAFDVWWALRGIRKCRSINRRGVKVKFIQYCLYSWGSALLITLAAAIVDNSDLSDYPSIIQPGFNECLTNGDGNKYYITIPIAILTSVNIILFIITVYNVQLTKRAVMNNDNSNISQNETFRFNMFFRLSVMMGVSWFLETIPCNNIFWKYALINSFNLALGFIIFIMFVCRKKILLMLCKKFGIQNQFVEKMQNSRSKSTRSTNLMTSMREKTDSHAADTEV